MATSYRVNLRSAADDGTNLYCEMEITDGLRTMALVRPTFSSGTSATVVRAYMQTIANNQPTIAADIQALINVAIIGV